MKFQLAAALAAIAFAGAAYAQPPGGGGGGPSPEMQAAMQNMRQACAADAKTLCSDKQPGRETMMCLRDNAAKTSDGCKDAMMKVRAARQAGAGGGGH